MRFLGHGDVAPAASVDRALLWPAAGVTGFHPADPLIFFVSFRQIPKVGESMWRCVPFCEEPMLQIPRPTPTCTRFKASIEMPCIKCGTQMRLTLVEPRDSNFDLLTYSCAACDCSEVFLNRSKG
jgi:hypothetical protein